MNNIFIRHISNVRLINLVFREKLWNVLMYRIKSFWILYIKLLKFIICIKNFRFSYLSNKPFLKRWTFCYNIKKTLQSFHKQKCIFFCSTTLHFLKLELRNRNPFFTICNQITIDLKIPIQTLKQNVSSRYGQKRFKYYFTLTSPNNFL